MIELSENISDYILQNFGGEYLKNFKTYVESDPSIYLRLPLDELSRLKITDDLKTYDIQLEQHFDVPNVYQVLKGDSKLGKTLEYTIGKYYVQSLSSAIPALVLDAEEKDVVLDLCAAPGSKTTQISEMMDNKGTLYSNEPNPKRIKSLVYNLDRMNILNNGVIQKYGELLSKQFSNYFDKILVDAPCSGLGIVQKKGEISNWWDEKAVLRLSNTQLRLLISAVKMAKEGGEIVYSTCTLTFEENELILNTVLKNYPVELVEFNLPVDSHPAFNTYKGEKLNPSISKAKRITPWEIKSEGFFIAKLRKIKANETAFQNDSIKNNFKIVSSHNKEIVPVIDFIFEYYGIAKEHFENYKYIIKSRDIHFVSGQWNCDNSDMFVRIGAKFGKVDNRGNFLLNSLALQNLGEHITQNIIVLDNAKDFNTYFAGGIIKSINDQRGQKAVKYKNYFIGTAVATKDGLKVSIPAR